MAQSSRKEVIKVVLAGDIGGTKTDLALFRIEDPGGTPLRESRFANVDYKGPEDVIESFLQDARRGEVAFDILAAVFGVAAPVEEKTCRLTNIDWLVDGREIMRIVGTSRVELINDLVATGWGLPLLSAGDLCTINKGARRQGNAALIAAGTGLGEAVLFWDGVSYRASASEGGHTDFAPRNPVEMGLLSFLMDSFGHVSYERIVSGPGLVNIYGFLARPEGVPERIRKRFKEEDPASVIADEAQKAEGDATCREALDIFVSVLGAEAGNLALKTLAVGGIYVGGGIPPKIMKIIGDGLFMEAFVDKGRFRDFLSSIPVHVIMNPKTALIGAANYGSSLIEHRELSLAVSG